MKCDIHTVHARNKPLSFEAVKSFRGGHFSSTPNYLNIYFLGPHACWGAQSHIDVWLVSILLAWYVVYITFFT